MSGETKLRVHTAGISKPAADKRYLKLDQTTPQDVDNGAPNFNGGADNAIVIKAGKRLVFDG